ncbi:HTH_Tnp_Tc3_2 domain-containing protein [Trichonephila clavipes]|nr:HTH_Tnp_Tc3_2 domain-containing protein [Trichonephila clavipes]
MRIVRHQRSQTLALITTQLNDGASCTVSKRTVQSSFDRFVALNPSRVSSIPLGIPPPHCVGFGSRRPTRVPLLNACHQVARLAWARQHRDWSVEDRKRVTWSDEPRFRLLNADGRLKIWRQAHETMNPAYQIATVQGHGGSIMVTVRISSAKFPRKNDRWRHHLSPPPQFCHGTGGKYSPVFCTRESAHKNFGPTDLTSTYSVCTRRVFGSIGHRTQAFRSGVRCSNHQTTHGPIKDTTSCEKKKHRIFSKKIDQERISTISKKIAQVNLTASCKRLISWFLLFKATELGRKIVPVRPPKF